MGRNSARLSLLKFALVSAFLALSTFPFSDGQLQPSQVQALLTFQRVLEFPPVLNGWNNWTNFCGIPQSSSLTIVCYGNSITELSIVGDRAPRSLIPSGVQNFSVSNQTLSSQFSIDSLFITLSQFPGLKTLSLVSLGIWGNLPTRISQLSSVQTLNLSSNFIYGYIPMRVSLLKNLQILALDRNRLYGPVPSWVGSLPFLSVLDLSNNALNGSLPSSLGTTKNLTFLSLSKNNLSGDVPDLSGLIDLQVLDLAYNFLGPKFPALGNKIVKIALQKNKFTYNIPHQIASFEGLQSFDVSSNRLVGPILLPLFSMPSIQYLNLSGNRLTGVLRTNMTCNPGLQSVDISNNLLTGSLPSCLATTSLNKTVSYSGNCLEKTSQYQHQLSFCSNEAIAAIPPPIRKKPSPNRLILLLGVAGGIVLTAVSLALLVLVVYKRCRRTVYNRHYKSSAVTASANFPPKLLTNAKYISHTMNLGPLGLPPYRLFTIEEIEEATDNFDRANLMGEGSQGQLYRGRLNDGFLVAVRSIRPKQTHTLQSLMQYIEPLSKIKHRHLVSTLGHCIVSFADGTNVETIYLVFEFISNGSLSSHLYEGRKRDILKWSERVSTAMGVARGIKFLHTGVVPGIYGNDLKAENILLDQNLTPKICKYNLPTPLKDVGCKVGSASLSSAAEDSQSARVENGEKLDVYGLGVILLELIVGRRLASRNDLQKMKEQVHTSSFMEAERLKEAVDPSIRYSCSYASIRTVVDITLKCLSEDPALRPSVEDVIWHLQYSAQVQDGSTTNSHVDDYPDLHI
ncbi:putative inactive leucine-rich repeat receptor-like protein kinase [Nymphaea thermarum]|nr:putative inactive leucine-rich repeat receptor-like protein kinase [Nymphaea thermarum]